MVKLAVATDEVNLRTEPSAAQGNATVIEALPRGTVMEQSDYDRRDPSWVKVMAPSGNSGFSKRLLLCQVEPGSLREIEANLLSAYNGAIWEATEQYEHVEYKLGAKDPEQGTVDCSGWIAFINRIAFSEVNKLAGQKLVDDRTLGRLNTHSDHQVSLIGYSAGQIFSIDSISTIPWRPGLLIGINFSDYDWEKGQGRVFEIDHIVETMQAPDGSLHITQSSSGGGGVNKVALEEWLRGKADTLRAANRLHVVDAFSMCAAPSRFRLWRSSPAALELKDLDTSRTPAG
jgi:hypothetical protein